MNRCSDGHAEVCFESRDCPVCEKQFDIDQLEKEIEALNNKIDDMNNKE